MLQITLHGTDAACRLLRIVLHSASHLSDTIGLLLHLLDTLSHVLHLLLEFLIFRRNATQVSEALSQEIAHLLACPWCEEQADTQSHQQPVRKTTHLSTPFLKIAVYPCNGSTLLFHRSCG